LLLKALAFDPGPIDGFSGPLTFAAIKKYEAANQRSQTGNLDRALLEALRRETNKQGR
jgi:peptidoglycan hydrolase-like protein with peptidoglycan-binding domain